MQKLNIKLIAFSLILVFTQKLGLRLWLHDFLHAHSISHSSLRGFHFDPSPQKCNCIEDLMTPMSPAERIEACVRISSFFSITNIELSFFYPVTFYVISLRGPPART